MTACVFFIHIEWQHHIRSHVCVSHVGIGCNYSLVYIVDPFLSWFCLISMQSHFHHDLFNGLLFSCKFRICLRRSKRQNDHALHYSCYVQSFVESFFSWKLLFTSSFCCKLRASILANANEVITTDVNNWNNRGILRTEMKWDRLNDVCNPHTNVSFWRTNTSQIL